MTRRQPGPGVVMGDLAPHIAAEVYRAAGERPVVIVSVPAPSRRAAGDYLGPAVLILCTAAGIGALVLVLLALVPVVTAAVAALTPTAGGITLTVSLARRSRKA